MQPRTRTLGVLAALVFLLASCQANSSVGTSVAPSGATPSPSILGPVAEQPLTHQTSPAAAHPGFPLSSPIEAISPSSAKSAFLQTSAAICARYDEQLRAGPAPPGALGDLVVMLGAQVPARSREETDLKALGTPAGDETTIGAMFDSYDELLAAAKAAQDAAAGQPGSTPLSAKHLPASVSAAIDEMATTATRTGSLWDAYGAGTCARSFQAPPFGLGT